MICRIRAEVCESLTSSLMNGSSPSEIFYSTRYCRKLHRVLQSHRSGRRTGNGSWGSGCSGTHEEVPQSRGSGSCKLYGAARRSDRLFGAEWLGKVHHGQNAHWAVACDLRTDPLEWLRYPA